MGATFALVSSVVTAMPELIKLGYDIADLWTNTKTVIDQNRVPGDAEWDALDARVNALRAELHTDPQS